MLVFVKMPHVTRTFPINPLSQPHLLLATLESTPYHLDAKMELQRTEV